MAIRKGFTLVELLAVIIILGLVGLIAIPSVTKVMQESRENLYQKQVQMIEESGRKWGVENIDRLSRIKKTYLSVDTLLNNGYIEQNSLSDPRNTDNEMNGCVVIQFSQSNNKYTYEYTEEECRTINTNFDLTSTDPEYVCYDFDESTGTIMGYDKSNPICPMDIYIPGKIDGVAVSYIGEMAFCDGGECSSVGPVGSIESENDETLLSFAKSDLNVSSLATMNNIDEKENYLKKMGVSDNELAAGTISGFSGRYIENIEFPESIIGIAEGAFAFNNISNLNLSDLPNLRYIAEGAFFGNQIDTITFENLPNLEYIGDGSFSNNYITLLELKDLPRLEEIGYGSFEENNITTLTIQGLSSLYEIYGDAFADNQISNLILNDLPNLEYIGYDAFTYNNITSVDLTGAPNLYGIGDEAFSDNNINSINLSGLSNLNFIEEAAFANNLLTSLDLSDLVNLDDIYWAAFAGNNITSLDLTNLQELDAIGGYAFADNLISTLILGSTTELYLIGEGAFSNNLLTNITIPANIQSIQNYAFEGNPIEGVIIEGDQYRFNSTWEEIGFPSELRPVYQTVFTLSTSSPNNILFVENEYYQLTAPTAGTYKLEVWGAQGGNGYETTGGLGGYSTGNIYLNQGQVIYVYVGGKGGKPTAGYNGGGVGGTDTGSGQYGGGGGGATDIRIGGTALANRAIIAGGGAGGGRNGTTGVGGGTDGTASITTDSGCPGNPGTQSAGGTACVTTRGATNGSLGQGGNGSTNYNSAGGGAGGGGYYGGGGGTSTQDHDQGWSSGGGGGSGYIGGVTSGQTIAGNASMPNPSGGTMTGRTGDGYARITYVGA